MIYYIGTYLGYVEFRDLNKLDAKSVKHISQPEQVQYMVLTKDDSFITDDRFLRRNPKLVQALANKEIGE